MGKLSLKKNRPEKSEKQTTLSSFFKSPSGSNSGAASSSLFSTVGGGSSSSKLPKTSEAKTKSSPKASSSANLGKRSNHGAETKNVERQRNEDVSVIDLTDDRSEKSLRKNVGRNVHSSEVKDSPGRTDTETRESGHRGSCAAKVTAVSCSSIDDAKRTSTSSSSDLVQCLQENPKNDDVGASAPGSFFFGSTCAEPTEKCSDMTEQVSVIPETQIMSPEPQAVVGVSHDRKIGNSSKKGVTVGVNDGGKAAKNPNTTMSDLDDSLTFIPPTPETKPLGSNARKRVQGRSFMLSASNLSASHLGFKPRKQLRPKGKSSKPEPTPFEGCNFSLMGSNKEVEKYSDLQMQVLYSAHGMTSGPASVLEGGMDACTTDMDCSGDGPVVPRVTTAVSIKENSSDARAKKSHIVSSKIQKHSDRFGKVVSTSDLGDVADGSNKSLKGGVKRACAKGLGISPNPKRLTPKQHYGEVLSTKRNLNSDMDWCSAGHSTAALEDAKRTFGTPKHLQTDAASDNILNSPDYGVDFEDSKMVNPHKTSSRKQRLKMLSAADKAPDKKSLSYSRVLSGRNKKTKTSLPNVAGSAVGDENLASDEFLSCLIYELRSPTAGTSTPKMKTSHKDRSKCDMNLSGVIAGDDGFDCCMDGVRSLPQDDDEDILSDIIGEIRGCTQATQAHSYDKKLNRKWKKLDDKNRSFSGAVSDRGEQGQLESSTEKLKTDLNSNFPSGSVLTDTSLSSNANLCENNKKICGKPVTLGNKSSSLNQLKDNGDSCDSAMDMVCDSPVTLGHPEIHDMLVVKDNLKIQSKANIEYESSSGISEQSSEQSQEKILPVVQIPEMEFEDFSMDGSWMEHLDLNEPEVNLSKSFSKFSPFNKAPEDYHPKDCPPPCTKFGRHLVTDVQPFGQEVHLILKSIPDDINRKCILRGFWADTHVKAGDVINVLSHFDASGISYVSDKQGLLVVNPDYLVSGTTVVGSVYCMRRSVLNAKFKGMDGRNVHMLYGSIIHSLFQKIIQDRQFSEDAMLNAAHDILKEKKFLHEMYALGLKEEAVLDEIKIYIPQIISWGKKHVHQGLYTFGEKRHPKGELSVIGVKDIEENVWSPRFGIKGKIDVTVDVKIHKTAGASRKIVPLELKTGKSSFSVEHKGQVTLYSMMMSDRRPDPEMGILLYLKDGAMQNVPAEEQNKKGLLQLRNELTHYLTNSLEKVSGVQGEETRLTSLPRPISNDRACKRCPHLLTCALYQSSIEHLSLPNHPMESLVPDTLSHLSPSHLDYFVSWCYMLQLEDQASKARDNTKGIWCKNALEREGKGGCLSTMILSSDSTTDRLLEDGNTVHTFVRHPAHPSEILAVSFVQGESVVISCENKGLIALSIGYVMNFTENLIELSTDRNLRNDPEYHSMIFRLDKCNLYNSMATNFSNLAKLMEDDPASARLRELLIEHRAPEFSHTLSKGAIEKVKHIFKKLNKPQKSAVLKVLMSQDYVLIKGYPGTGKTSTIIALVRMLVCLGCSVLLTSYTHSAVDNILLKLIQNKVDFLRLGRLEKIHPSVQPYSAEVLTRDIHSVAELESFYASKQIVATTCFGVTHQLFTQRFFDVCIVDEASQILQPACMGPLFYAKKFALVGDPQQLPPVVQSKDAMARGMDQSLIVRLDTNGATYELDVQYRMNRSIMELSNQLVYDGILKCGSESVASSCLRLQTDEFMNQVRLPPTCEWIKASLDPSPGKEVLFLDTTQVPAPESRSTEGQLQNEVEAMMTLQVSYSLVQSGVDPADIGIIAPYRNQVQFIKKSLESLPCLPNTIEVNTVDQYQGRDKDVIIISYVRSQRAQENTGDILHDLRRLNVAITRAKHKLIFIGHVPSLRSYGPLNSLIELLRDNQIYSLPAGAHAHLDLKELETNDF
ncbi:DNA replication ATP-dependent helicase/nuclease DNA2-like [Lineus longissimus]|uniref:DNA replication ATP-dependent helicase/nuclease DNA2-like n=1 Tax=Lineus longissimus TaxID=88925 RepID=UPI00315D32FD